MDRLVMASVQAFGSRRLQSIDALRGAAALGVVVFHASLFNEFHTTEWPGTLPSLMLEWGRFGVWLFFVISGFCIHLRWAREYRPDRIPRLDFFVFWKRRFIRLYPPYVIALVGYVVFLAFEGVRFNATTLSRIGLHVLLLNNTALSVVESVNGVFWTLAVEEQLYLAYFLLLALRVRFGWTVTLACCLGARVAWFVLAFALHHFWRIDLVVTQSAAAQWIVWALGALSVEAAFGIVRLPSFCYRGWLGTAFVGAAMAATVGYIGLAEGMIRNALWCANDVLWGIGFFIWVNCAAEAERRWRREGRVPRAVAATASLGVFSYSLYLTHELVILHLWPMIRPDWISGMTELAIVVIVLSLVSVAFARLFFAWFERPFMDRARAAAPSAALVPAV